MGEGSDPWELPFLSQGAGQGPEGKTLAKGCHLHALGVSTPGEGIAYHIRTV